MTRPEISIIVPVFNRERFLPQCLDSLIGQTMKNIEIICVNDGSTDGSLAMLEEYQKRDARIVLLDLPRSGVASARNAGLDRATAPYIMWCDSDDYYNNDMCEQMYQAIIVHDVDIAICAMSIIFDIPDNLRKGVDDYVRLKYFGKQALTGQMIVDTDVSLPNKIFKKAIIDSYGVRCPDGLHFEDALFCDEYLTASKNIYYLNHRLYNYVRHENSIMSSSFNGSSIAADYLQIIYFTYAYLKQNNLFEQCSDFFWHRFIQYYAFAYDNVPRTQRSKIRHDALSFISEHPGDLEGIDPQLKRYLLRLVRPGRSAKVAMRRSIGNIYRKLSFSSRRYRQIEENLSIALQESYEMKARFEGIAERLDRLSS